MTQADVLTAIDDALDTGVATETDPVARELQELALMLRADAPEPTDAYSESLDKRVEQGFPKRSSSKAPWWRPLLQPAAFVAMVAVPVLVITALAGGLSGSSGDDSSGSSGGAVESAGGGGGGASQGGGQSGAEPAVAAPKASDQALPGSSQSLARITPAPPSGRGFAPGRSNRKIERTVSLELEAPVDEMQRVADQVTSVTNRHGGFVLSSSVSTGDGAGGDFNLRIPASELRPALRDLSAIADVRSQSQTGRDVTPEHVTARQRLRSARAERKSLLRRLEVAATDTEAEAIRRRLDIVAGEINGLRGHLHSLRLRTDYAVVRVELLTGNGDSGGGGGGSFGDALRDAGDILVAVAGILVRALAVAIPLAILALLGWLAGRALQRRRRESALI
jgi:Domain of unknown function (DUF4349)